MKKREPKTLSQQQPTKTKKTNHSKIITKSTVLNGFFGSADSVLELYSGTRTLVNKKAEFKRKKTKKKEAEATRNAEKGPKTVSQQQTQI